MTNESSSLVANTQNMSLKRGIPLKISAFYRISSWLVPDPLSTSGLIGVRVALFSATWCRQWNFRVSEGNDVAIVKLVLLALVWPTPKETRWHVPWYKVSPPPSTCIQGTPRCPRNPLSKQHLALFPELLEGVLPCSSGLPIGLKSAGRWFESWFVPDEYGGKSTVLGQPTSTAIP